MRPALLVTGTVSPYRREPFRLLSERQRIEVAAYVGAGPPVPGLTVHRTTQTGAVALAASGRYRAVICGLGGRVALPGTYAAARARRIPFVLWATIWAHPRTPAHLLSRVPTRHLYRHADAVATYGDHVSRHVAEARGERDIFVAPQAVDVEHFGAQVPAEAVASVRATLGAAPGAPLLLFVGRLEPEKGVRTLLEAWRLAGLGAEARLAVAGDGPLSGEVARAGEGVRPLGYVASLDLPPLYRAADALVVPSLQTATFLEPWGLVVNEAMLQRTPVIASDAVGAVAGGLVRPGRNGLTFPAGDAQALAARIAAIASSPDLRQRLGATAAADSARLTPAAWADGMERALAAAGTAL
jgi:glycosyltransferase involved in cell wall biosynthesis